ncbi:MAG: hypothetical protein HY063_05190 [Bacteroidetes bacterium]|nr:hypothetical protein [Bacteroidota bacterium]
MKKIIKRVKIALNLQTLDSPGLVSLLRAIVKGFNGPPANPNFTPADIAKLPVTTADMLLQASALENTHTTRETNKSGNLTALELDQSATVQNTLLDTAAFVEGFANKKAAGDTSIAVQIITSVGFGIKKAFVKHQRSFEVVDTDKGLAHLRTVSAGRRAAYLWQWSADGGKTWSFPIATIGAEVIITNLKSAVEHSFRFAAVVPVILGKPTVAAGSEEPAWSDVITVVIP